ncbi:MAG: hypothetical protein A2176_01355 [Spirochaetes bacterium RBG_13_51_14]|nr:MAG: hypothetical protein A2176_01355 [Spirochaetes bacterium RBG_13_51_14]
MRLSTRTRYGVRAMLEIALHNPTQPVDLNEISKKQGISKKYLHTLLTLLKNNSLVVSIRGNAGGYLLARKPEDISLYEIFRILEGTPGIVDCVENDKACRRFAVCTTRKLWRRLSASIQKELECTSLADLVADATGKKESITYNI